MVAWWPRVTLLLYSLLLWRRSVVLTQPSTSELHHQDSCGGGNSTWPCTCENWNNTGDEFNVKVGCCCTGQHLVEVPIELDRSNLSLKVQRLTIDKAGLVSLTAGSFKPFSNTLRDIVLTDLPYLRSIENGTFSGLPHLRTIDIKRAKSLQVLPPGIFSFTSGKLDTIRIMRTGLLHVPDLSQISNGIIMNLIDLEGNHITNVRSNTLSVKAYELILDYNDITFVESWSFNGSEIAKLSLKGNKKLNKLSLKAFAGLRSLHDLDLSETAITQLPTIGLEELEILRVQDTQTLKEIPSVYSFKNFYKKLEEDCGRKQPADVILTRSRRDGSDVTLLGSTRSPPKLELQDHSFQHGHGAFFSGVENTIKSNYSFSSGHIPSLNEVSPTQAPEGFFHKEAIKNWDQPTAVVCGNLSRSPVHDIKCYPAPDAFNPCEDIMGTTWLRVAVWVVVVTSVLGNLAVIIVIASSRQISRMTVPKFLMCNLAFADLCMGTYLLLIAAMDAHSIGVYFNFAHDWQNGPGCKIAGFITVFASQLSVYTLSIITLERWLAITYAMYLNKRLNLRMASHVMMVGWLYALTMAALPLFGISGYSKTSICLPLETSDIMDVSYLVFLLVMNGLAFLLILICYIQIYLSLNHDTRRGTVVGTPGMRAVRGEMNVAKKMALLVFTDLACWAPIAFFGLTAVAGYPLIDVTRSKILLVSFYPLNSCANPFLYAILTSQYRRDVVLLFSKYGIKTKQTEIYRREAMIASNVPLRSTSACFPAKNSQASVSVKSTCFPAKHSQASVSVNGKDGTSTTLDMQQFSQEIINIPPQIKDSAGSKIKVCLLLHGPDCTLCKMRNTQEAFL